MIHAMVLYPESEGCHFDFDYYLNSHMPLLAERFGKHCLSWSVEQVLDGPYRAIGHVQIDSLEALNEVMARHGEELMNDRPNWTNIEPAIVITETLGGSQQQGS